MCNKRNQSIKMLPTIIIVSFLIFSGLLKISGYHPMRLHFVEMGVDDYLTILGLAEIIFGFLFLFPQTTRLGLLFLTAYFGGAIAMEMSYNMVAGPGIPLAFIWIAAFVRQPEVFVDRKNRIPVSMHNNNSIAA